MRLLTSHGCQGQEKRGNVEARHVDEHNVEFTVAGVCSLVRSATLDGSRFGHVSSLAPDAP